MTTRSDYSDDEWRLLAGMPQLAGVAAMAAEDGGPVTSTRELWASMKAMAESAKGSYPDNALIQDVVAAITHHDGLQLTPDIGNATGPEALHMAVVQRALTAAPEVRRILEARSTPEEAAAYRAWIVGIVRAGIGAAQTGFLGMSGARVTQRESLFLNELETALGAPVEPVRDWER